VPGILSTVRSTFNSSPAAQTVTMDMIDGGGGVVFALQVSSSAPTPHSSAKLIHSMVKGSGVGKGGEG